ncbi:DivIVA domain-containing protein [Collinsella sp. AGMB00827]|uniref:Cell wall synthesis protein Wag31 n=1 Tax=Collinsella ureilytica TaxID=2869515 RepID=A0ABS7MLJ2_9ACTN|nr:DivIVA domain-containing protein [Collinsella urealyticum]MBY4797918.1 DivIVA domain-containing protein [Collinsella urealyticum]
MAITPADIQVQQFSKAKHGYNPVEVDEFLERISAEVDAMLNKIVDLKGRLTATEQQLAEARSELERERTSGGSALAAPAAVVEPSTAATERQISAALIAAQQTADAIVAEANDNAERIRTEADAKAREVIRQALAEKQNEIAEIDRLKASREEFKNQYLNLIQHFMDDAQNSFPAELMSNLPTGSGSPASPALTMPAAPVQAPAPAADPFAPQSNFAMDDLD